MALALRASGSHLYPGARGTLAGEWPRAGTMSEVAVEFADGSLALGQLSAGHDGGQVLSVGPYVTARGTAVADKRWVLTVATAPGGGGRFRIAARVSE